MAALAGSPAMKIPNVVLRAAQSTDSNIGSATGTSNSASTLVSTLVPVFLFALVWFMLFLVFRRMFPRRYRARAVLSQLREPERTPDLPTGILNWVGPFFGMADSYILQHHSMDGYLFIRFLKMMVITCLVGCAITWPVLFPVNATGGGGHVQLDLLTFANVSNPWKFYAHAGCAYLFFGFVMFMITRESIFYINLRQAFLMSPLYASRLSSRTVLFTSVPQDYLDEAKLKFMFGQAVRRIWIATDTKELDDLVKERDKVAMKLEGAETKLGKLANAARLKSLKGKGGHAHEEEQVGMMDPEGESGSAAAQYIQPKQRPTHRLKPLIGKKVDTINWSRTRLAELIPKVEEEQAKHRSFSAKKVGSVFVEFTNVSEAQAAYQSLTHHQPLHMAPRYGGVMPGEVIWSNLKIPWWQRAVRTYATLAFVVALIVFWSIPVAFVGSISNVNYLCNSLSWLCWIQDIPQVILGVVTGLLPSILLSVLMALLPIILRLMARLGGDPTLSAVELTVQNYYFAFQVVQVFLVSTLSSAASAAVSQIIHDPTSVTSLLSQRLPLASNYFLAYELLQGLAVVASTLVGLVGLIIAIILGKFLDSTPRKMYKRWTSLASVGWGTVMPIYTNLVVIAICYSCIAPLVSGFAAIGLYLFYLAYRYNFLFVYDVNIDTKGLIYPRALQQLFVGLYVAEVCLLGLFAIRLADGKGAIGPFVMMIVLVIFTALYQLTLNSAIGPLLQYLPKSIDAEERHLLAVENGNEEEMMPNAEKNGVSHSKTGMGPAPHKRPNFLVKFLKPHIYNDYATMRRMVPQGFADIQYAPEVERDAFYHPSITSETPVLWIPRDPIGVSRQEIAHTSRVIPISDEGARFDEKNKIVWDKDSRDIPIYNEKIYY